MRFTLHPSIVSLTHLTVLNLPKNYLEYINESIKGLINLRELDLSENAIEYISNEIGNLTNLVSIKLNKNKLKELPEKIGLCFNLKSLVVDNNDLRALPITIGLLTNLETLTLKWNKISEVGLPSDLNLMTHITKADFSKNNFSFTPSENWIQDIQKSLKSLKAKKKIKVYLVGNAKVGKTTLSTALSKVSKAALEEEKMIQNGNELQNRRITSSIMINSQMGSIFFLFFPFH